MTLTLLEVRDSRCPTGSLCPLLGKATAVIQIGPGKRLRSTYGGLIDRMAGWLTQAFVIRLSIQPLTDQRPMPAHLPVYDP